MAKPVFDITESLDANLLEICPIIKGAFVSKPLIDTGAVKIVLVAIDAEQEFSEHRTPYVATIQLLDGRMNFGYRGQTIDMQPNDWALLRPNEPHDLSAVEPTRFLLTLLKQ